MVAKQIWQEWCKEMLAREEQGIEIYDALIEHYGKSPSSPPDLVEALRPIISDERKHIAYLNEILKIVEKV